MNKQELRYKRDEIRHTYRKQFLGELKALLTKWDAEIEAVETLEGKQIIHYAINMTRSDYVEGQLSYIINGDTEL